MDAEVLASILLPLEQAGFEVEAVDDFVDLLLPDRSWNLVHLIPD